MKNLFVTLAAATLVTTGMLVVTPQVKAEPGTVEEKLVFSCEFHNNQLATIPQLVQDVVDAKYPAVWERTVMQEYSPLLVWTETLSSDHPAGAYTPEGRCQAVSDRLTNLASSMGIIDIQELSRVGVVNHERVIFLSESAKASADEVIFTLKPTNRNNAQEILQMFQVGVSGAVGGEYLPSGSSTIYE